MWESFHHPRAKGWHSNALGAEDVGSVERRYIAWAIRLLAGPGRFVDKTPSNVLRLPYLEALFADAAYVFVHRDGRAVVSSLYESWALRPHPYSLPGSFAVQGVPPGRWGFAFIPGWQEFHGRPLEEVCAEQYIQSVEALLDFRERLPADRFVDLRYEDLLADPVARTRDMFRGLDVPFPAEYEAFVRKHVRPGGLRGGDTPPAQEKWTQLHPNEIERVLPRIRSTMERDGYRV